MRTLVRLEVVCGLLPSFALAPKHKRRVERNWREREKKRKRVEHSVNLSPHPSTLGNKDGTGLIRRHGWWGYFAEREREFAWILSMPRECLGMRTNRRRIRRAEESFSLICYRVVWYRKCIAGKGENGGCWKGEENGDGGVKRLNNYQSRNRSLRLARFFRSFFCSSYKRIRCASFPAKIETSRNYDFSWNNGSCRRRLEVFLLGEFEF